MPPIAGGQRSGQCLVENRYMDESEQSDLELLVKILDEELEAQFGIGRAHDTEGARRLFASLLADAVIDRFRLIDRMP